MAITPLNTTHPIIAYTFSGAGTKNLGVDILGLTDPSGAAQGAGLSGMCVWFGVQNQTGGDILIISTVGGTKGILIKDGDTYRSPIDANGNGYDVFEYWVKASGAGDVVVERKIG